MHRKNERGRCSKCESLGLKFLKDTYFCFSCKSIWREVSISDGSNPSIGRVIMLGVIIGLISLLYMFFGGD